MKKSITFAGFSSEELDALCAAVEMSPDSLTAVIVADGDDREREVKLYDDGAPGWDYSWYVLGHEYGPTMLVRADGECSAYSIWVDESPTIEAGDVHEAYGAFDKLLEHMESLGHANDYALRDFCTRWDEWFFEVDTRDANHSGAWDRWGLLEGYEMQSNSSGTGIVYVGDYAWMRELDGSGYSALFSGVLS
jgi:hypothetical protein